jgi:DinB superfamily
MEGTSFEMARDDVELVRYAAGRLDGRLAGLTDDEYLWEPVPDCWTIRLVEGRWQGDVNPAGTHFAEATPPPFTTIAWRLWHLGASPRPTWPQGPMTATEFTRAYFSQIKARESPAVGRADEACELVRATWANLGDLFASFADAEVAAPIGPVGGPFADTSLEGLILHVADELIHHGAEVGVVRDLYMHRG